MTTCERGKKDGEWKMKINTKSFKDMHCVIECLASLTKEELERLWCKHDFMLDKNLEDCQLGCGRHSKYMPLENDDQPAKRQKPNPTSE